MLLHITVDPVAPVSRNGAAYYSVFLNSTSSIEEIKCNHLPLTTAHSYSIVKARSFLSNIFCNVPMNLFIYISLKKFNFVFVQDKLKTHMMRNHGYSQEDIKTTFKHSGQGRQRSSILVNRLGSCTQSCE